MSVLKIIDLDTGFRLFRWQHEKEGSAFVEWKREQTLLKEIGVESEEEEVVTVHGDWEWDVDMMIQVLKWYRRRGVKSVEWEHRGMGGEVGDIILDLERELIVGWGMSTNFLGF
jgi:hypothetical protein